LATGTTLITINSGLTDQRLFYLLCFPKPSEEELRRRLRQLSSLGVTGILLDGPQRVNGLKVLGKGCDSVVVKALMDRAQVALKIRRVDSHVKTLIIEGENQRLANSVGVGAKVYCFSEDFIVMDIVEGRHIDEFVRLASGAELKRVVIDLLRQCRRLDVLGLDHGELSRAHRHVIVKSCLEPVIMDFGSSSRSRRPANVSSLFSYLFLSKTDLSALVREKLGALFDEEEAIKALREYKRNPSENSFKNVLSFVTPSEIEINSLSKLQP